MADESIQSSVRGFCAACCRWVDKFHCNFCAALHRVTPHVFPATVRYPPDATGNILFCPTCDRGLYLEIV